MAFGWSAGDILSAINLIIEVANALDEVDQRRNSEKPIHF
jgi:hypothetical protein